MNWREGLIASLVFALLGALLLTPAAPAEVPPPAVPVPPGSVTLSGLDLHDGTIVKAGSQYVMVGTRYGCGFQWGIAGTPWCGFGVSTAPTLKGPWSPPTLLFNPADVSPYSKTSFAALCGQYGAGCFNPRLIQRTGWGNNDGAWILWFNAPADFSRTGANAYYSMGCNSPTGPCGTPAGAPFGSTTKPSMYRCHDNGDFSIINDAPRPPVMLCTQKDQTLASERLSTWGTSGTSGSGAYNLGGVTKSESPGAYRDASGSWIMTFNEYNCGYCNGSPTSYLTAPAIDGAWSSPSSVNAAWGSIPLGRRGLSATSCGGQARTVTVLDGQAYQWIDVWYGERNQTNAKIHLEPLTYRGAQAPGDPWQPFVPWKCGS